MRRTNCQNSQLFCEIVKSGKILGVSKRGDLKWHKHVEKISAKASQRIYLLRQLKSAGIDRISLINFTAHLFVLSGNMPLKLSILFYQSICLIKSRGFRSEL